MFPRRASPSGLFPENRTARSFQSDSELLPAGFGRLRQRPAAGGHRVVEARRARARGVRWSLPAAITTTGLLTLVFAWRASVGWLAVFDGKSEKLFAAVLITAMLAGSAAMLPPLFRSLKTQSIPTPQTKNQT